VSIFDKARAAFSGMLAKRSTLADRIAELEETADQTGWWEKSQHRSARRARCHRKHRKQRNARMRRARAARGQNRRTGAAA